MYLKQQNFCKILKKLYYYFIESTNSKIAKYSFEKYKNAYEKLDIKLNQLLFFNEINSLHINVNDAFI